MWVTDTVGSLPGLLTFQRVHTLNMRRSCVCLSWSLLDLMCCVSNWTSVLRRLLICCLVYLVNLLFCVSGSLRVLRCSWSIVLRDSLVCVRRPSLYWCTGFIVNWFKFTLAVRMTLGIPHMCYIDQKHKNTNSIAGSKMHRCPHVAIDVPYHTCSNSTYAVCYRKIE